MDMKKMKFIALLVVMTIAAYANTASAQNTDSDVFTLVEVAPMYIGGQTAMMQFLSKNLQYPAEAMEKNVQGTVYVSFIVEKDGSISNVVLKRDIGSGCGEEAVRVVKMMPKWTPGKQKGKEVRTQFVLPVTFKLN